MQYVAAILWSFFVFRALWDAHSECRKSQFVRSAIMGWRSIRLGMSVTEIRELLGRPGRVFADEKGPQWRYGVEGDTGTVKFYRGEVVEFDLPAAA